MTEDYEHMEPGEEIRSISGHYTMEKELLIRHAKRDVLVVVGHTIIDSACCGAGGCRYAFVPGYVSAPRNHAGISRVDPITDPADRDAVAELIHAAETVQQIIFA